MQMQMKMKSENENTKMKWQKWKKKQAEKLKHFYDTLCNWFGGNSIPQADELDKRIKWTKNENFSVFEIYDFCLLTLSRLGVPKENQITCREDRVFYAFKLGLIRK